MWLLLLSSYPSSKAGLRKAGCTSNIKCKLQWQKVLQQCAAFVLVIMSLWGCPKNLRLQSQFRIELPAETHWLHQKFSNLCFARQRNYSALINQKILNNFLQSGSVSQERCPSNKRCFQCVLNQAQNISLTFRHSPSLIAQLQYGICSVFLTEYIYFLIAMVWN